MARGKKNGAAVDEAVAQSESQDDAVNGTANGEPEVVETKADKFRRLANKRLFKAEKALLGVQRLASRATYDYSPQQAEKLSLIVAEAAERVINAFKPQPAATAEEANYF